MTNRNRRKKKNQIGRGKKLKEEKVHYIYEREIQKREEER